MIKSYSFKNFGSYKDETTVDFKVSQKTAHSYFDQEISNEKVSKVAGVFGANGSGKSNLLSPLAFLGWFVPKSFQSSDENDKIPFETHFSQQDENCVIEIEYCNFGPIKKNGSSSQFEYRYKVEFNNDFVVNEELKIKTSHLYSTIFSRVYDSESHEYSIKRNSKLLPLSVKVLKAAPKNCSLISYALRLDLEDEDTDRNKISALFIAGHYFTFFYSNLNSEGRSHFGSRIHNVTSHLYNNSDRFEKVKKLLLNYDLGISDIVIEDTTVLLENGGEETRPMPFCIHECDGESYRLPMSSESSGTISAFSLLTIIVQTLDYGGIAVLDEFDNDLHPHFAQEIVELYKSNATNPLKAQLIFTSHTTEMLKVLRKQHVYITEKEDCISEAYRADELEGLKDRDNLYAKYINGALGGVPAFS